VFAAGEDLEGFTFGSEYRSLVKRGDEAHDARKKEQQITNNKFQTAPLPIGI
jgi:hypothetical protein